MAGGARGLAALTCAALIGAAPAAAEPLRARPRSVDPGLKGTRGARWAPNGDALHPPSRGEQIGVLRIDASGVSAAAGEKFEQGVIDGLTGAGFRVVDSATIRKALETRGGFVDGCTFGPCLGAVHAAAGVRFVLVARLEGVGRTYSFVVSLLESQGGRLVSQVAERCPVCTVDDAITTATLGTIELVTGLGEPAAASAPRARAAPWRPDPRVTRERRIVWTAGWITIGVGAAAAVTGLALDDDGESTGRLVSGAGLGLIAGGLATLWYAARLGRVERAPEPRR